MPLLIGFDPAGLDLKTRMVLDEITAAIQVWAGRVDGINAEERLSQLATGVASLSTVKPGTIEAFGGPAASIPSGYLLCDGSQVSRTTYASLFAAISTTWGAGDGSSTFHLPDGRGRAFYGQATGGTGSTLGGTFGSINHTHTISGSTANESAHTHGSGSYATPTHDHGGLTGIPTTEVERQPGAGAPYDTNPYQHVHSVSTQAAMSITGTSGAGSAHAHGAGTLAAAASNPPGFVGHWMIKA